MKTARHPTYGATTIVCVWRDLSHPLDGPAAPRRRLRRLSSVVDGPAQAGRSRWTRGTISPAIWAEQRAQRAYVSTERVPRHTLTWLRDARESARHERMRALPRGPSRLPRQAGLRQESARKEQRMSYTSHDLLDAARRAIPEVSVEAVAARRTRGDEVVLLDVREKDEVRTGYIEGAVTIPRGLLEFQAAAHLPQTDMDVVVYCASGARSLLAAQVLRAMGYTHVASMAGGITRWQEAGPGRARPATQCGAAGAAAISCYASWGKRARANCSTPK